MSQISTHVLDTVRGYPAEGIAVTLYRVAESSREILGIGRTNAAGRIENLQSSEDRLSAGNYELVFETGDYLSERGETAFYPRVEVIFRVEGDGQHYHIPLLLSAFGYSTYKGI